MDCKILLQSMDTWGSMEVHIGKIIQETVKQKGLSVTEFAKSINYSRRNVYEIFEKKTIDTGVLKKISEVLGENLFLHYIDSRTINELPTDIFQLKQLIIRLEEAVEKLEKGKKT